MSMIFEVRRVQIGSQNRSKIDTKNDAETERLGKPIFIASGAILAASWPSKTEPRRSKIDVEMASKFDQYLKASWNATFSAQEPPRRASAADRRTRKSPHGPSGGGLRRGKTDVQAPRTFESGTWSKEWNLKGQEDLDRMIQHTVPGWAAD